MPAYQAVPQNKQVQLAVSGLTAYLLGSHNRLVAATSMTVTSVQLIGTTATIGVIVKEGNVPTVGQLVSITGAVPSYFNVSNSAITAVSSAATPDAGVYTIQFTLVNSNTTQISSPGLAVAPQIEISETLFSGASAQLCIQSNTGPQNGRSIRFDVSTTGTVGAAVVKAQSADYDIDSEYQDLGTILSITGGVSSGGSATFVDVLERFVRFNVTAVAGNTSGKIIGKVLV